MVWHDCKTDPPKKDGWYILWYKISENEQGWNRVYYYATYLMWKEYKGLEYKWAEVNLSE